MSYDDPDTSHFFSALVAVLLGIAAVTTAFHYRVIEIEARLDDAFRQIEVLRRNGK